MSHFISIAIDGPAASGKSSVGLEISKRLDYLFLDTGVMYRAMTWAALNKGFDINDEGLITEMAREIEIKVSQPSHNDGRLNDIYVDGIDITRKITEQKVNDNVSQISKYQEVRKTLTLTTTKNRTGRKYCYGWQGHRHSRFTCCKL